MISLAPFYLKRLAKGALAEDVASGDITTLLTIPQNLSASAEIIAKEDMVVAGMQMVRAVFKTLDGGVKVTDIKRDGERAVTGDCIASVTGPAHDLLTGERVALNYLQRMAGIATLTARYVELVAGTKARIVDTRKTTPGLRRLEKYAVTVGGGHNHRFGLFDGILIKDNHIAIAGGVRAAVEAAKHGAPHTLKIEVEVTTISQLEEAISAGADAVLLDNMSVETMRRAVEVAADLVLLEASGGVNEENVRAIAETGVDLISVGALTHSARAMDISVEMTPL